MISVCIPAYKQTQFLERLLDSLALQSFKDFEVIVSDDSPDESVWHLCNEYKEKLALVYQKNNPAKGTPANWNEAIRRAKGEWIKIMHDDDWFRSPDSLIEFVKAAGNNPGADFIFSAFVNVYEEGREKTIQLNNFRKKKLFENVVTLFSKNVIGPPSVVLVKNNKAVEYDTRMKWMVDVDYYMRYITRPPVYINKPLINVGINKEQVTNYTFRVQKVEIPENFLLLEKMGTRHLKDILIYDAWWRIIRNLGIRNEQVIRDNGYEGEIPVVIKKMISWQSKIPLSLLRIGPLSKVMMFIHYLTCANTIQ